VPRVVREWVTSYRRDVDGGYFVAMKDELIGREKMVMKIEMFCPYVGLRRTFLSLRASNSGSSEQAPLWSLELTKVIVRESHENEWQVWIY
jgi:hypothetical protein